MPQPRRGGSGQGRGQGQGTGRRGGGGRGSGRSPSSGMGGGSGVGRGGRGQGQGRQGGGRRDRQGGSFLDRLFGRRDQESTPTDVPGAAPGTRLTDEQVVPLRQAEHGEPVQRTFQAPQQAPADPDVAPADGRTRELMALCEQAQEMNRKMADLQQRIRELEEPAVSAVAAAPALLPRARVDVSACAGCGACVEACPTGAIVLSDGVASVDQAICRGCGVCLDACPNGALALVQ